MRERSALVRILALAGTVAVWLPIVFMLLTGAIYSSRTGDLRVDYLLPAELFLLVILGGGMLFYASHRTRFRRPFIQGALAGAVLALVLSQVLATVTGLASGAVPAEGLPWILVLGLLILYDVLVVVLGVAGVLLLRDLGR
jgi:hypothetical protein